MKIKYLKSIAKDVRKVKDQSKVKSNHPKD